MAMGYFQKALANNRFWNLFTRRNIRLFANGQGISGRILEIGCGAGLTTAELARLFPSAEIHSVSYDREQLWLARQRVNGANVNLRQWDTFSLAYDDSSFDSAFEFNTFHRLSSYKHAIREVLRVLRPGAVFYVMDVQKKADGFSKLFPSASAFTAKEFYYELKEAGFRIKIFKETGHTFFIKAAKP